jgi:FkbM family methyltransferase
MGDTAWRIWYILNQRRVKINGIFASSDFVRGQKFLFYPVRTLEDIEAEEKDFIVILAFASNRPEVLDNIYRIARKHTLYIPDLPVIGDKIFTYDYCLINSESLQSVYTLLQDNISKQVFADVCNFRISGDIGYLKGTETHKDDIYYNILRLGENETYLDLGAYDGDTIKEFQHYTNGKYEQIVAFEPAAKNFKKLQANTQDTENLTLYQYASWCTDTSLPFSRADGRQATLSTANSKFSVETKRIDSLDVYPTYIKMDVEGAEFETLWGGHRIITSLKPKLAVPLYHRTEDIFKLPLLLKEFNPKYKFYIRRLPYIPAWDLCLYCV